MVKYLVFLESYIKKETIQKILGNDYLVFATQGHIYNLENSGEYNLGIDLTSFQPSYQLLEERKQAVKKWKEFIKKTIFCTFT